MNSGMGSAESIPSARPARLPSCGESGIRPGVGNTKRASLALVVVLAAPCALSCSKDKAAAPAPSASIATPAPAPSAAPAAAPQSKLRVLAESKDALFGTGANGDGVVVAKATGLQLVGGKPSENPELALGLENPRWSERQVVGADSTLVAFAGKRDPDALQLGDRMMYMEDPQIGADRTVFRAFKHGGWVRVGAVDEGESLGGFGRFRGRIVAAVVMPGSKDYRFKLVAGKPGIALPAPTPADKPPEPAAADTAADGGADGGADGAAEASAAVASAAPPPKPADPSLPNPALDAGCETRVVPSAFDGLESGEAMVVGRVCPGTGDTWVEHWPPKKRKAAFEKIPQPPSGAVTVVMTAEGQAVVAVAGTRWAIERKADGSWAKLEAPGSGSIQQVAASPAGRLWLVVGGRVFSRSAGAAFSETVLPDGKQATRVFPSDNDEPFVLTEHELIGPASAGGGVAVSIEGGATSLCTEPYVIIESHVKRTKKYADVIDKVKGAGVSGVSLVFGHRGMAGVDSIQAKAPDMKTAHALSKALGGAAIVCGAPRTEAKVPGFD